MGVVRKGHLRCTFDSSGSRQWPHLLLPWFRVTPLFQSSFVTKHELGCKWNSFYFLQEARCSAQMIFIYSAKGIPVLSDELWKYSCTIGEYLSTFVQLFMHFEYTKAVTYTAENVGVDIGQDPATEVAHLGLNQPPVFSSASLPCMVILKWRLLCMVAMVTSHFISCYILTITRKLCKSSFVTVIIVLFLAPSHTHSVGTLNIIMSSSLRK